MMADVDVDVSNKENSFFPLFTFSVGFKSTRVHFSSFFLSIRSIFRDVFLGFSLNFLGASIFDGEIQNS